MRDTKKNKEYFEGLIEQRERSEERRIKKIHSNEISEDRMQAVKVDMAKNQLYLTLTKYSSGISIKDLSVNYYKALSYFNENWSGYWKQKQGNPPVELNQYTLSAYDEMLWMLSLGYLLKVPNEEFQKLVEVIDRDKVVDKLFEFIISAKLISRKVMQDESYSEIYFIPEIFSKLRNATQTQSQIDAESLIKEFINTEWYKGHKDAGWYNSHNSNQDVYSGYWCFEAAAVTCIMGLDDSTYREHQYYPKDLVDYFRNTD